jgi:hypothetical protein
MADPARTVNAQFLVEVHDSTAEDIAAKGMSPAAALLELNGLFTAWVETCYNYHVHSETGQPPMTRWKAGWDTAGHGPVMPAAGALTEAFLWSALRTVTKTATVSLHGNTYQVEAALAGRKVEMVFSPFNLEHIEIRYQNKTYGQALPHYITRHAHPKARPETPETPPVMGTGIDYLAMIADTHHQRVAADETINFDALYPRPDGHLTDRHRPDGELPGQLSIDDIPGGTAGPTDSGEATG